MLKPPAFLWTFFFCPTPRIRILSGKDAGPNGSSLGCSLLGVPDPTHVSSSSVPAPPPPPVVVAAHCLTLFLFFYFFEFCFVLSVRPPISHHILVLPVLCDHLCQKPCTLVRHRAPDPGLRSGRTRIEVTGPSSHFWQAPATISTAASHSLSPVDTPRGRCDLAGCHKGARVIQSPAHTPPAATASGPPSLSVPPIGLGSLSEADFCDNRCSFPLFQHVQ